MTDSPKRSTPGPMALASNLLFQNDLSVVQEPGMAFHYSLGALLRIG
jgi:hypothetical protein